MAPDSQLDADALHARARADTGLDDFGPDDYRERLDVYDFMADELRLAQTIYDIAGEPLTAETRSAMAEYLAGHRRGGLGQIATSAEMFGLDERDLRTRFSRYVQRFLE